MRTLLMVAGLVLAGLPASTCASTIVSRSGVTANVASAAAGPLQCVVNGLEASGYRITSMGGYRAHGSVAGSLHPRGMALDVNQVARNRTVPPMPRGEIAIASACGTVSGAQWGNPDSGHFQVGGWSGREYHHGHRHRRR